MKALLFLLFTFLFLQAFGQQSLETVFETSSGKATATYDEVIAYYRHLTDQSPFIQMKEMGMTDSGLPLHLVILDLEKEFDFEKSFEKGKAIILVNNGIHPGEPDGIEASMMLMRDYAMNKEKHSLIENTILAIVPVYNIGGALNRNSVTRVNQNGPEEYGFRGNARNYDLNRDFIKADTRNTLAFYDIFHHVNPDIFIDTHVSNGADYQYNITHLATQYCKMGGAMGTYIENEFTPKLESIIKDKGNEIVPYVNVFNTAPDKEGFSQFLDNPRYSTGYTTLFHTLGFMIETHMLKPFDRRVQATYDFLETILELAQSDGRKIRALKAEQGERFQAGDTVALSWRLSKGQYKEIAFKGYVGEMIDSKVTGKSRLLYGRNRPFTATIPYYNYFTPNRETVIPKAYIVPQGWHNVIDRLLANRVVFHRVKGDTSIVVEGYSIEKYNSTARPYEGHFSHKNVGLKVFNDTLTFRAGDYIFPTGQFAGRYLVETLEPEATDSFFSWNFFDTILQQKEGFSPYVFEEVAWHLLKNDAELKQAFEAKKKINSEFAENWYAQLDFIYKHSEYYEKAHLTYPVYRLIK
ncbi:hypothetical protein FNH22_04625 [Fulvivirga sp. M361]|uniref:M14 family metallopeptidase n=1 Tax=Fulvivirga sp. M361 TaxID=2594266 RepID=UPI0011799B7A|nr:M14 family metallopeptidase [Fulvivirga sp. M361]TRX61345.1 hypothetical protein FNH22_04625 [Fulvivirga sp. M361]